MYKNYLTPETISKIDNLYFRARRVVEGFIVGNHQSPYHGFSAEFSEHRAYGLGDEIKHIDWKLYGKTQKLRLCTRSCRHVMCLGAICDCVL